MQGVAMDLDVSVKSVYELFSGKNVYTIPNYQRDYSWKDEQSKEFFEDILKTSGINSDNFEINESNKYFFGMISLIGDKSGADPNRPYSVIDGQQRITTMLLFYRAIEETIDNLNRELPDDAKYSIDIEDRLICKTTIQGEHVNRVRLLKGALDPFFPVDIIDSERRKKDGATAPPCSDEQMAVRDVYDYIKDCISKSKLSESLGIDSTDLDDHTYKRILDNLSKHLDNAQVICIYHQNASDAHTLFRNLNSRGIALNQTDLIKSDVFSNLGGDDGLVEHKWSIVQQNVYEANEDMQKFLYHYFQSKDSKVKTTTVLKRYNEKYKSEGKLENNFLEDLHKGSVFYKNITHPDDNEELFGETRYFSKSNHPSIKRNLIYLQNWRVEHHRSILLKLFELREKEIIDNRYLKKMVDLIAYNQCLFSIVGNKTKGIGSAYRNALTSLIKLPEEENIHVRKEEIYRQFKNDLLNKLPNKDQIIDKELRYSCKSIEDMKKDELRQYEIIRFVLSKLAEARQESTNQSNDAYKFIRQASLEHIVDRENQGDNLNILGNILLLEQRLHDDKKEWEEKLKMYESSSITMTREFADDYPDFNQENILDRNKKLLDEFYELVKSIDQS